MDKKKNIIIVLLILIILLLGGYIGYTIYTDSIESKKEKTDISDKENKTDETTNNPPIEETNISENNQISKDDSKYLVKYLEGGTYNDIIHIYDIYDLDNYMVYAYKGQIYITFNQGFSSFDNSGFQLLVRNAHKEENKNKWKQDNNTGYSCYNEEDDYVCKTTIKESEIQRARIYHTTLHGPDFGIFYIYKDGRVFANHGVSGEHNTISKLEQVSKLKDYQVSDLIVKLERMAINNEPYEEYNYYAKLKNGTIKKISFYED